MSDYHMILTNNQFVFAKRVKQGDTVDYKG